MAGSGPRNNLQDVLRRNASNPSSSASATPLASGSRRFKPAQSSTADDASRPGSSSGLPSFATSGFSKPTTSNPAPPSVRALSPKRQRLQPSAPLTTPRRVGSVIDLASPDHSPRRSSVPQKRLSSEHGPLHEPASPSSKRLRREQAAEKENAFTGFPVGNDDLLNPFVPVSSEASGSGAGPFPGNIPSHRDLLDKSIEDLDALLQWNTQKRMQTMEACMKRMSGVDKESDQVTLDMIDKIVDGRMNAIRERRSFLAHHRASREPSLPVLVVPAPVRPATPVSPPLTAPSTTKITAAASTYGHGAPTIAGVGPAVPKSQDGFAGPSEIQRTNSVIEVADSEDDLWESMEDIVVDEDYNTQGMSPPRPHPVLELEDDDEIQEVAAPMVVSAAGSSRVGSQRQDTHASPYYEEVQSKLKSVFGLHTFRPNQLEAITATLAGKDVFVLMPTGGGKSLCYQLPAVCQNGKTKGVTFVISPLLALLNDQVTALRKKNIAVLALNSEKQDREKQLVRQHLLSVSRKPDLCYVTPEQIAKSTMLQDVLRQLFRDGQLARFVLDEAHLISSWGRDFREESYQALSELRNKFPGIPIMALTATANEECKADIIARLNIPDCVKLLLSFNRPNLHYVVKKRPPNFMQEIANAIKSTYHGESGIIYATARAKCEDFAKELREQYSVKARHYHAGMTSEDKQRTVEAWFSGQCQVVVATIAFGMGVDKADVRFVFHVNLPGSLAAYYQETGRAGRDGRPADCIMYWHGQDLRTHYHLIDSNKDTKDNFEERQRQKQAANMTLRYCENTAICRRVQVLGYFDEVFDAAKCHKHCDVCLDPTQAYSEDLTPLAIDLVKLVQAITPKDNLTQAHVLAVFRGQNLAAIRDKGHDREPLYGAGKELTPAKADRLLNTLMGMNALKHAVVTNRGGYSNTYLKPGPAGGAVIQGRHQVVLQFKDAEGKPASARTRKPSAKQLTAGASASTSAKSKGKGKGKGRAAANDEPIEAFSDHEADDAGYAPDFADDDIEDLVPPRQRPMSSKTKRTLSGALTPSSVGVSGPSSAPPSNPDPFQTCFDSLKAWRGELAAIKDLADRDVLPDDCLEMLALMTPSDGIKSVEIVFRSAGMPEDEIAKKAAEYGPAILRVFATDKSAPPIVDQSSLRQTAETRVRSFKPAELHDRFDYKGT